MRRRDFLRSTGWFVVGATLAGIPGCGGNDNHTPDAGPVAGTYVFPQGVASGDPRTTSVVLWTRAARADGGADPVALHVQVASDAGFATIVADQAISATDASDHTVRVLVTGLAANTAYYYRFTAGLDVVSGQTRTAPDAAADVQVNLAWVSCQDYGAGTYGAYRQLLIDDAARAAADQIHFVVHLGDVIYETVGGEFQIPLGDDFKAVTLANLDGTPRTVAALPDGATKNGNTFAHTVADYRHLYRTFLSDPDSMAARARWPFIHTWDDHEFTNDSWQSQANYDDHNSVDEPSQARKLAASQVWFEFVPAQLTGAIGPTGVTQVAKDFATATVADAPFTTPNADNFVDEANNAAAIGAMTIFRSFRWGKHVELVMTDLRSYRSDHAIPEDLTIGNVQFFDPRNVIPIATVAVLDAGATVPGGAPDTVDIGFNNVPNPRKTSPAGTMMGKAQKQWWKDTLKASDATWKLWGNEVPLMRFLIRQGNVSLLFSDRIMDGDAWDGYPSERNELLTYVKDQGIKNLVVLSGDIHAHFAGVVMDNWDVATPTPVATELIAAGISSNSLFSFYEFATRKVPAQLRNLIVPDASSKGGPAFAENLNLLLLHGTNAADKYGTTFDLAQAQALYDDSNPHLKYADANAQGYGYAKITATQVESTLVTINRPITQTGTTGPGVKRTATFTIPKDNPAGMSGPVMTGTKPFPMA